MKRYWRWSEYDLDTQPYNRRQRYENCYYGHVVDVNDPHGVGAIKIHVPELMEGLPYKAGIWAIRLFPVEGMKSTIWYNQFVLFRFRNGDPNFAIVEGVVKHYDEAYHKINPKTWKYPKKRQPPEDHKTDEKNPKYTALLRKTKMPTKKEWVLGARCHVMFESPRLGHAMRVFDDDYFKYVEVYTYHFNNWCLSDTRDYGLIHIVYSPDKKDAKKSQELFLSGNQGYVELWSATHWSFTAQCKKKKIFMKSQKSVVGIDDKTDTVQVAVHDANIGQSIHILWPETVRWTPITRTRIKNLYFASAQQPRYPGKSINGSMWEGGGNQYHINHAATIVLTPDGFVLINTI